MSFLNSQRQTIEGPEDTDDHPEGPEHEAALSDAFTTELVKNMQDLMRELADEKSTEMGSGEEANEAGTEGEAERLMKAAWEAMLIEGINGMTETGTETAPSTSAAASISTSSATGSDFQNKIKQTMEKLKESEDNIQNLSSSTSSGNPESLQGLLNSLKDLGLDDLGASGDGEEDEAELASFLESMMGQLMNKEFPPFLANPPSVLSPADQTRYEKQHDCVKQGGSDAAKVVDLMGELQTYGNPPESIIGSVPPELMGPDGGQCVVL
ncbi:Pex19 protein [Lentinula detonsa]|uniref:Pex19 protein n=1 Tax=Lentinula detonsa TaxID=2804962 RepID=A0A9W8NVR7_9AGAR|nr:Pex19 protein [Lentinula detonsa]